MTQTGKPRIPAGDTFRLIFNVVDDLDQVVVLNAATSISWVLALRENSLAPLLTKSLGDGITKDAVPGRFIVQLDPVDTEALAPRDYWQQARLTFDDGRRSTVIRAWLTILDVVPQG